MKVACLDLARCSEEQSRFQAEPGPLLAVCSNRGAGAGERSGKHVARETWREESAEMIDSIRRGLLCSK